jgi:hypothetical protein
MPSFDELATSKPATTQSVMVVEKFSTSMMLLCLLPGPGALIKTAAPGAACNVLGDDGPPGIPMRHPI